VSNDHSYDVVVAGVGSAESSAAIASARTGARTLLVDRMAFRGGTSTAVLDTFYAFLRPDRARRRWTAPISAERLRSWCQ
jgi:succinate dehydrogenase/fumarate reductase flavoprotein subunit